jgi:hypothetical protein
LIPENASESGAHTVEDDEPANGGNGAGQNAAGIHQQVD